MIKRKNKPPTEADATGSAKVRFVKIEQVDGEWPEPEFKPFSSDELMTYLETDKRVLWDMAELSAKEFKETSNPVHAIVVILRADLAGRTPPHIAYQWFLDGLRRYYESDGRKSLDECFGFRSPRTRTHPFQKYFQRQRDNELLRDVARLFACGSKLDDAFEMVKKKLEKSPNWDRTGWGLWPIAVSTLSRKYKTWKDRKEVLAYWLSVTPAPPGESTKISSAKSKKNDFLLSVSAVQAFLKSFPADYIPDYIKKRWLI